MGKRYEWVDKDKLPEDRREAFEDALAKHNDRAKGVEDAKELLANRRAERDELRTEIAAILCPLKVGDTFTRMNSPSVPSKKIYRVIGYLGYALSPGWRVLAERRLPEEAEWTKVNYPISSYQIKGYGSPPVEGDDEEPGLSFEDGE